MKTSILLISFFVALASGCASTETVKEAKGEGAKRTYPYAYERVYDAALSAAKTKNLELVESDIAKGRLLFSHGVTLWSWGERIAVFVNSQSPAVTEVEIVSKAVVTPLTFPPDWQQILLDQIDAELRLKK